MALIALRIIMHSEIYGVHCAKQGYLKITKENSASIFMVLGKAHLHAKSQNFQDSQLEGLSNVSYVICRKLLEPCSQSVHFVVVHLDKDDKPYLNDYLFVFILKQDLLQQFLFFYARVLEVHYI